MFRLTGEIDLSNAPVVQATIVREAAEHPTVVIDLTALDFMDSAAVRLLHAVHGELDAANRKLRVVAGNGSIARQVLHITGTDQIIPVDEHPPAR